MREVMLTNLLNVADVATTVALIDKPYMQELNPIMARLLDIDVVFAMVFKLVLFFSMILLLKYVSNSTSKLIFGIDSKKTYTAVICGIILVYSVTVLNNLRWLL